ncbi:Macro domain [Syntrophomonas zehnderi OL-4]|uniref:Macro domain n=1 Tax=Syntrophomonas zehnderi OL-4 TaxID=690567 RepID=A0A0E4G8V0_9FIRM|nr:macro domain-containing protein [Syntrophomonas zehnderi]CFW98046.1 Macro domain [Syntrophomonas zehnderi OL-4]
MPFTIVRQDITKIKADAIVNAANTDLQMGGGVCGAIFKAAGAAQLQAACDKLAPIKTGEAVITPGFGLPARFIIHAAGPVYRQWNKEQNEQHLCSAYTNSLKRAIENDCETIAFPLISSGIYGYPKDEALQVATSAIHNFLIDHDLDVTLVVYDKAAFSISRELLGAVESYIDEHYIKTNEINRRQLLDVERDALFKGDKDVNNYNKPIFEEMLAPSVGVPLDDLVGNLDEPFSQMLLRLINAKGMTDVEVYKRANLDRKLFSKIRSNKGYMPSKRTAIALAVALELSLDETDDLLERAGYALSHAVKFDVIVEYFITNGKYDVLKINEVLFEYDQPLLGG